MLFYRLLQFTLVTTLLASPTAMADTQLNMPLGVTPISQDIYHLHMTILWICIAIGIAVFSVMIYAMIYHRKSKGAKPAQFHEHLWVELTWTIIPFFILIAMAIPATHVLFNMEDTDQPDITIKVTGYQWKWKYEYLDQDIHFFSNNATPYEQLQNKVPKDKNYLRTVDHPLVLPIHKKVRFLVTSNDVIHSWWVPELGVKRDAIPGFINESWARINRAGTYHGQCAELCGLNHAYMPIVVIALPEEAFAAWVNQQKGLPVAGTPTTTTTTTSTTMPAPTTATTTTPSTAGKKYTLPELMQQGEKVYLGTCAVCHKPDGSGTPPTFPSLKDSKVPTGPRDVHLATVLNGRPGTAMQAFKEQLSDEDLAAVITYERNAWGHNTGDLIQPDEIKKLKEQP